MRAYIYIYSGIKFLKSIDFKSDLLSFTQCVSCLHFPSACVFLFLYNIRRGGGSMQDYLHYNYLVAV